MGCDEGILLCGREFAGADTWATAYALVQSIRTLEPVDLVLCGERATDGETGQVGPMVAAMWDVPLLTYVTNLTCNWTQLRAQRAIEGGTEEVGCRFPAVACVVRELNEPRLPTLSGKVAAHDNEITVLDGRAINTDASLLGLNGSPTRVVKVVYPSFQRSAELFHAIDKGVDAALDYLESILAVDASQSKEPS